MKIYPTTMTKADLISGLDGVPDDTPIYLGIRRASDASGITPDAVVIYSATGPEPGGFF